MLSVHYLEVTTEVIVPLALDVYCGSALRGAFFRTMWERFCANREASTCMVCPLVTACPVASLVAPLRDEAPRGGDVPRPYVITPPLGEQQRYETGETFAFGVALLGKAAHWYPYVMRSLQEMERSTLGHPLSQGKRGRFCVREIHACHPLTGAKHLLWQRGWTQPEKLHLPITADDVVARAQQLPTDRLTLHFLSPTRLIDQEHVLRHPDFRPLVLRLAQRLEAVQDAYGQEAEGGAASLGRAWYLPRDAQRAAKL